MKHHDLISPEYRDQLRQMLEAGDMGGKGDRWTMQMVTLLSALCGREKRTVLDYGCGQGALVRALAPTLHWLDFRKYDPAVPGLDAMPEPADFVLCTDVLEHVEPERLGKVLNHIDSLAKRGIVLAVALQPTEKTLPDGRPAHLIVKDAFWWIQKLEAMWLVSPLASNPNPKKWLFCYASRR